MSSIQAVNVVAIPSIAPGGPGSDSDLPSSVQSDAAIVAPPKNPRGPAFSSGAAAILLEEQNKAPEPAARSVYETYMPVREGFTAHALAVGVKDPDAVSSSAGLDDAGVAADARARMDDKYARMAASGKPFGPRLEDWDSLIGDLDRRSLTSVRNNESGLFTKQEQDAADNGLQRQDGLRLGGYNGPANLFGQFVASGLSFFTRRDADDAMAAFDASASKDKSIPSQLGRASMRVILGADASSQLFAGAQVDADDKMLTLLVDVLTKAREKDPEVLNKLGHINSIEDLKNADWFADQRAELDEVLAAAD